jgi:hypothetical protein
MKSGHDHHQRADAAVWITIGVIAMADMGFALLGPFELDWRSFWVPGVVTALLAAGGWFYRSVRRDQRLGAILSSTAHIIGFAAVGAPLSYIAATAGFPLQDQVGHRGTSEPKAHLRHPLLIVLCNEGSIVASAIVWASTSFLATTRPSLTGTQAEMTAKCATIAACGSIMSRSPRYCC